MFEVFALIFFSLIILAIAILPIVSVLSERDMEEEWFIYTHNPKLYREFYNRDHP